MRKKGDKEWVKVIEGAPPEHRSDASVAQFDEVEIQVEHLGFGQIRQWQERLSAPDADVKAVMFDALRECVRGLRYEGQEQPTKEIFPELERIGCLEFAYGAACSVQFLKPHDFLSSGS